MRVESLRVGLVAVRVLPGQGGTVPVRGLQRRRPAEGVVWGRKKFDAAGGRTAWCAFSRDAAADPGVVPGASTRFLEV